MKEIKDYHCNLTLWQDLVKKGDLIYPNENVVRFIFANNFNSALDFGCGNGRHLEVFLRAKIKKIIGVDMNEMPLKTSFARLNESAENSLIKLILLNNKNKNLKELLNATKIDAVVAWGVLHLFTPKIALDLLKEFKSVLNDGGQILCNFRSKNDGLKNESVEISKNIYKVTRKSHENLLYSFYDEEMIKEIFKQADLKITSIDKEIYTRNNSSEYNEFLVVKAVNNS